MSPAEILRREHESGRVSEIEAVLAAAARDIEAAHAGRAALVLAGDWNAPSHLDWTAATAAAHSGLEVAWPTSLAAAQAGLRDTFREAHPDPAEAPGVTWSPLYPFHEGSTGAAEPQDRIDFVYAAGDVETVRSDVVARGASRPYPDNWRNEWPSDHAAVVSELRLRVRR